MKSRRSTQNVRITHVNLPTPQALGHALAYAIHAQQQQTVAVTIRPTEVKVAA